MPTKYQMNRWKAAAASCEARGLSDKAKRVLEDALKVCYQEGCGLKQTLRFVKAVMVQEALQEHTSVDRSATALGVVGPTVKQVIVENGLRYDPKRFGVAKW